MVKNKDLVMTADGREVERHRVAKGLKPGYAWNPLKKFPRNVKCFCGSGKKFKNCCLSKLRDIVDTKTAREIKKGMDDYLVKENA